MNIELVIDWAIRTKQSFMSCDARPPLGWNWSRHGVNGRLFSLMSQNGETITKHDVANARKAS